MSEFAAQVDVRDIMPREDKYPTVQRTFAALNIGEKMELVNDHDSRPIFEYKFPTDFPGQFEWSYVEQGPQVWRHAVTKIAKES